MGLCVSSSLTFNGVKKAAPPRLRLLKVFATSAQSEIRVFLYSHGNILRNRSLNVEVGSVPQASTNVFHEGNALYKSQNVRYVSPELPNWAT